MRKPTVELPELNDEEMACEMIELTCDDMQSLTKVFHMLTDLCAQLSHEVAEEAKENLSDIKVH